MQTTRRENAQLNTCSLRVHRYSLCIRTITVCARYAYARRTLWTRCKDVSSTPLNPYVGKVVRTVSFAICYQYAELIRYHLTASLDSCWRHIFMKIPLYSHSSQLGGADISSSKIVLHHSPLFLCILNVQYLWNLEIWCDQAQIFREGFMDPLLLIL